MQDIKISNGYIQLWATYLRSLNIEPLTAEFLADLRPQLIGLIDQPLMRKFRWIFSIASC